jgi:Fur family ferric uptake transcriptional regulator
LRTARSNASWHFGIYPLGIVPSPRAELRQGRPAPRADLADRLAPVLEKIRARGGRVTWPRIAILEAFVEGEDHLTVDDLEARVRATAPEVHQATFYRTVAALEQLGVIYHLHVDHGPSVWHLAGAEHEHLVCQDCGAVIEVDAHEFDVLRVAIAERFGFVLDTRHFVSQGWCRDCAARRLTPP